MWRGFRHCGEEVCERREAESAANGSTKSQFWSLRSHVAHTCVNARLGHVRLSIPCPSHDRYIHVALHIGNWSMASADRPGAGCIALESCRKVPKYIHVHVWEQPPVGSRIRQSQMIMDASIDPGYVYPVVCRQCAWKSVCFTVSTLCW